MPSRGFSVEQAGLSLLANNGDSRVLDAPLGREHVETRFQTLDFSDQLDAVSVDDFPLDGERSRKHTDTLLCESLDQCTVVKFRCDRGTYVLRLEPALQRSPIRTFLGRQQHRCAIHTLGKTPPQLACQRRQVGEQAGKRRVAIPRAE